MQFQRAHSFVPPKQQTDVPVFNRAQSFVSGQGIEMSVNTLYNHAVRYHKTEKDMDLAESAFKAALSRDPSEGLLLFLGCLFPSNRVEKFVSSPCSCCAFVFH